MIKCECGGRIEVVIEARYAVVVSPTKSISGVSPKPTAVHNLEETDKTFRCSECGRELTSSDLYKIAVENGATLDLPKKEDQPVHSNSRAPLSVVPAGRSHKKGCPIPNSLHHRLLLPH